MGLSFNITEKLAGRENAFLSELKNPSALNTIIGRKVSRAVITHFQTYSASHPNKLGGRRTNYVASMGDATTYTADSNGAKISVSQEGARLRIEGGTITPKKRKYLTIPAIAEAYGKRASEFNNITFLYRREGGSVRPWAIAEEKSSPTYGTRAAGFGASGPVRSRVAVGTRYGRNHGRVLFFLVRSANIPANRNLLLSDDQIMQAALDATRSYIRVKGGLESASAA
jgi:hypothetical protein